jgi:adenosine deaminase
LSGAVYAERFIAWAAQQNLCADPEHVLLSKPRCDLPGDVSAADAMHDQKLYDQLVNAFSTRSFVPTVAVPSDHDKFFAAFDKFGAASGSRFVDMTIDQLKQYDSENVQYVEFMASFACWNDRDRFIKAMAEQADDRGRLLALRANGLDDCVTAKRVDLVASVGKIRSELGCDQQATRPGCRVTFRYIAQILRNTSPDDVFLQTAVAAALIRAEPQVVALNLVQSEDNLIARSDYTRHMEIVAFLASDVPVALHAGELWLGDVPPPDLTFISAKPSRSPVRAASATASRSHSNMTWMAFWPRCGRGRSWSRSTSRATPSSSGCTERTIRLRPTLPPACRWCSRPTMPAFPASI